MVKLWAKCFQVLSLLFKELNIRSTLIVRYQGEFIQDQSYRGRKKDDLKNCNSHNTIRTVHESSDIAWSIFLCSSREEGVCLLIWMVFYSI